jgi:hypothetical protein
MPTNGRAILEIRSMAVMWARAAIGRDGRQGKGSKYGRKKWKKEERINHRVQAHTSREPRPDQERSGKAEDDDGRERGGRGEQKEREGGGRGLVEKEGTI